MGFDLRLEIVEMETRLTEEVRSAVHTYVAEHYGRVVRTYSHRNHAADTPNQ